MLRSGRTECRPVSLLSQEAGGPQLRPQVALLFAGGPQYLVGFVFFGQRPQEQQDIKKEAFDFDEVSIRAMVPGVGVIGWVLGGRLRQCPQRLVVEPTGGVKGTDQNGTKIRAVYDGLDRFLRRGPGTD